MAKYRILLVDDQHEIRRVLRAGIESLGPEFQVLDMPSGEEAMLVLFSQPFDLLIADIWLPGISGLELKERVQRRKPDLKIILITGLTDLKVRQQARDAGAYAFFTKPIVMADFLDAVERALGVVKTMLPPEPILASQPETAGTSFSERMAALRHDLEAEAVLLLDDQGKIIAEAGSLPELANGSPLLTSLMAILSAGRKIGYDLGSHTPEGVYFSRGVHRNLALIHVGAAFALLVAAPPEVEILTKYTGIILPTVADLLRILDRIGASAGPLAAPVTIAESTSPSSGLAMPLVEEGTRQAGAPSQLPEESPVEVSAEERQEFEEAFGKATEKARKVPNLDDFWEAATQQTDPNELGNASAISYDQARKLGLAPGEDSN